MGVPPYRHSIRRQKMLVVPRVAVRNCAIMSVRVATLRKLFPREEYRAYLPLDSRCFAGSTWASHGRLLPGNFMRGSEIISVIARVEFSDHLNFLFSAESANLPLICTSQKCCAVRWIYRQKWYLRKTCTYSLVKWSTALGDGEPIQFSWCENRVYGNSSPSHISLDELFRYE